MADSKIFEAYDLHIGRRLRELRESRGLTQAQLAAQLGVTFQQLQKYERGVNRVAASRLYQAALVLDVQVADLMPPRTGGQARAAVDRIGDTAAGAALAIAWDVLTEGERRAVMTVVVGMTGDRASPLLGSMPEQADLIRSRRAATVLAEAHH